jgi:hypothetical protein
MAMGHVGMSVDEGLRGDADAWQRGDRFLTKKKKKKKRIKMLILIKFR